MDLIHTWTKQHLTKLTQKYLFNTCLLHKKEKNPALPLPNSELFYIKVSPLTIKTLIHVLQGNQRVPIILPKEVQRPLQYLADTDVRKKCGIKSNNQFIFANTGEAE